MTITAPVIAPTAHPIAAAVAKIKHELNGQFYERAEVIDAIWLAILAKEHCFILGSPGTGKSFLVRQCFDRIRLMNFFEVILSKTRPAEAVLGPMDIPELRDNGHLFRKWNGFLPWANFAMIDEIGKMSPTLGHDLLAVLLERRLHQVNGGRSWIDLLLYTAIGGSNELPTDESDDAAALWDRMLVRAYVEPIHEAGNWAALMTGGAPTPANPTTVDFPDLADAIDNVVPAVTLPNDVIQVLVKLRDALRKEEVIPSDRRWTQSRKLLQASAFLDGRTEVTTDDIAALRFVLWDSPEQMQKVERLTLQVSNPLAEKALAIAEKVSELTRELGKVDPQLTPQEKAGIGVEMGGRIKSLVRDIDALRQEALTNSASTTKIDQIRSQVQRLQGKIHADLLNIVSF